MDTDVQSPMSNRDIFLHAVQIADPQERREYLKKAYGGSVARLETVERMIAADASGTKAPFDRLVEKLAPRTVPVLEATATERIVKAEPEFDGSDHPVIGPYKLLEPIGEGGMGVVYLAQQSQPVRRKVALKIIKPGMDSRQVIARFEAERQALAMMEHPNIAKVLDAGTTGSGLPYFVMELVRGIPITEYCDRAKMPMHCRLELFQSACRALQHAHNKGIIHRDIKPSNVLVTEHDGTPVLKVIDFGVAKALTENLTDKTLYTGMFQMIGTPLYMSPEQASLSNLDVDTRSDVYSLGVLLYELVSGTLPIDRESVREMSFDELRQHICATDPLRPSKRLSTLREQREMIAAQRGVTGVQLSKFIQSELDWIIMQAIEKDRHRRYQSPRELADDIARFLAGEAVQACPPTLVYRTKKLLTKHGKSLSIALLLFLCLAVTTIVSINQAIKATQASAVANRNASLAEQKAIELAELVYAKDMVAAGRHYLRGEQEEFEQILQRHAGPDRASLRGFEWHFVNGLTPVETEVLFETDKYIYDFVITADGKNLIYGDSGGNIACIDRNSGASLAAFKWNDEPILAVELSEGGILSFAGESGKVASRQMDETLDLSPQSSVQLSPGAIVSLAFDGNLQWAGDDRGRIFAWDRNTGQTLTQRDWELRRKIKDLVVAPDGAVIAAHHHELCTMRSPRISEPGDQWRMPLAYTMQEIRDMDQNESKDLLVCAQLLGDVSVLKLTDSEPKLLFTQLLLDDLHSVAISPDGEWVAAGDASGHIHLLSTQLRYADSFLDRSSSRERQLRSWLAHGDKIEHLSFCAARNSSVWEIVSGGRDGRLVVSKPFTVSPVRFLPVEDFVNHFPTPSANCEFLWSHQLFDLKPDDDRFQNGHVGNIPFEKALNIQAIPGGDEIAVLVNERTLARIPKAESGVEEVLWETGAESRVVRFAFAKGAERFAICLERLQPRSHSIEIFRTGSSHSLHSIPANLANDMTFSPSGDVLAYVWNNDIALLDVRTSERLHLLRLHTDSIQDIDFSPDGKQLASVSSDRRLAVWDVETGKLVWSQTAHENRAVEVAFHPTLPTLASVGADSIVRFWSNRSQVTDDSVRLVGEFPLSVGSCAALAFSEDGKSLYVHHAERGVTELRAAFE